MHVPPSLDGECREGRRRHGSRELFDTLGDRLTIFVELLLPEETGEDGATELLSGRYVDGWSAFVRDDRRRVLANIEGSHACRSFRVLFHRVSPQEQDGDGTTKARSSRRLHRADMSSLTSSGGLGQARGRTSPEIGR